MTGNPHESHDASVRCRGRPHRHVAGDVRSRERLVPPPEHMASALLQAMCSPRQT